MASPEAETFLWRRIFRDERVKFDRLARSVEAKRIKAFGPGFAAHERFYATIIVKRPSPYHARQPGNASTPTKTIKSVALLGSDC